MISKNRAKKDKHGDREDRPMLVRDWTKKIKARKGRRLKEDLELPLTRIENVKERGRDLSYRVEQRNEALEILLHTKNVGVHRFPPAMQAVRVDRKKRPELREERVSGFVPEFLPVNPLPKELPRDLRRRRFIDPKRRTKKDHGRTTSVYTPDDRYAFSDTSFPWCTCGRVETGAGWGSGVMIGPRHIMTASHVMNWGTGGSVGWLRFTPLFFDGSAPFGTANGTQVYSWLRADDDGDGVIGATETAFDYVVVTLDRRLGENLTGWMGARGYSTSWTGEDYWAHIGYPSDVAGGQRPVFIGYEDFDSTFERSTMGRDSYGIRHRIDVVGGQSGGPYFGWWSDEPWPRVVGIQSTENWGGSTGPNTCGGGDPLSEIINFARAQDP